MATAKRGSGRAGSLSATVLVEQKAGGRFELSIAGKNIDIVIELAKSRVSVQAPAIKHFTINGKSHDNGGGAMPSNK
jgi:hypothetical protein